MPLTSFQAFIIQRRAELRRIAHCTQGEHTPQDVENEAWLIAEQIAAKRGSPMNFSLLADQEMVLAWLHNELVKYADKQVRYAVKLDKDWDREDEDSAAHSLANLLEAPETFDPAVLLAQRQADAATDRLALVQHSYSQASAYLLLLARVEWDLASHLHIGDRTLHARLRWCFEFIRLQAGIFDGVQTVPRDFQPTIARLFVRHAAPEVVEMLYRQLAWEFPEAVPRPLLIRP